MGKNSGAGEGSIDADWPLAAPAAGVGVSAAGVDAGEADAGAGEANLAGMSVPAAKEYILGFITALKLTEKEILSLEGEAAKWKERASLARSRGKDDLRAGACKEEERIRARLAALREEAEALKGRVAAMRKQLPGLAARERSVDPDLLEQELLMAAGYMPGDEEKAREDRLFNRMEKDAAASAALLELKTKMRGDAS